MEFELKWKGVRLGTIKFEVDASMFMPLLQQLGMFGLGYSPVQPEPEQAPKGKGKR